ncbi:MFS transporter [Alphaproteobacteria bacterium]|nr:MFS transporter [Alphaproteobacteria bacterium]
MNKNIFLLSVCQSLFNSSSSILVLTAGLTGYLLLDNNLAFATIPVSAMVIGTSISTAPAAALMKRYGRKKGFSFGSIIGIFGTLITLFAIISYSFWVFVLGVFLIGMFHGFGHHYRFAAAELVEKNFIGKAISLVVAGGIVAAFLGPEVAARTSEIFPSYKFLGAYISVGILIIIGLIMIQIINFKEFNSIETDENERPLSKIIFKPNFILAIMSSMIGYSVMVLVMTATPIAMVEHFKHNLHDAKFVIQWHVVAMFAPSFFTGSLISRLGINKVIFIGVISLFLSVIILINDVRFINFWLSLFFIGIGWNFTFIGGSTLLASIAKPSERAKVQGTHDFFVFFFVAISSILSGVILQYYGWKAIGYGCIPFILLLITILIWTNLNFKNK